VTYLTSGEFFRWSKRAENHSGRRRISQVSRRVTARKGNSSVGQTFLSAFGRSPKSSQRSRLRREADKNVRPTGSCHRTVEYMRAKSYPRTGTLFGGMTFY
jgi:hypothetical protein